MSQVISRLSFKKQSSELGTYWTANASKAVVRDHLRGLARTGTKWAAIGGEQEQGFEQAFSSLSYSFLRDKAPKLIDFIVGFQLVDRNDDNTKAVGVFGFKIGPQWLYAPVFFLNGDLKGHELLYIKNQDTFVPLKENWVNYVMSRKPHMLGEGSRKDVWQMGGQAPNVERMSTPPPQSKYGSVRIEPWARPIMPMLAALLTKEANFLYTQVKPGDKLDMTKIAANPTQAALAGVPLSLEEFLSNDLSLIAGAYELTRRMPGIKLAFDKLHGKDFFQRLGQRIKAAATLEADSVLAGDPVTQRDLLISAEKCAEAYLQHRTKKAAQELTAMRETCPELYSLTRRTIARKLAAANDPLGSLLPKEAQSSPQDKKPKVKIVVNDEATLTRNQGLNDEDKKKVLRHGYLVKDERKGDEFSHAYNTQIETILTNPNETGIYEMLESPGNFDRMLVVSSPQANNGNKSFVTIVRLGEGDKAWLNAPRDSVFARKIEQDDDYRSWWKKLPEKEELADRGTYIALSERGQGTCPFEVQHKYDDGCYKVDFHAHANWGNNQYGWDSIKASTGPYISTYGAMLNINKRPGVKLYNSMQGEMYVPDTFRFLKIKDPPKPKKKDKDSWMGSSLDYVGSPDASDPAPIKPGDLKDIQLLFYEKTAAMKIWGDASEVVIQTKEAAVRLPWRQGLFTLIRDHGLSEKEAGAIVKTAQAKGMIPVQYRVAYGPAYPQKTAGYYPSGDLSGGPTSPPVPGPWYGTENIGYNTVNSIYPQEEQIPVSSLSASQTDPRIYDPFLMPDRSAVNVAQQAGQDGQKEVFDTTMIAGMLKNVRQDSLVDKYLGDLMKAMNSLGRLLMQFYWHQDDFKDRYSKSSLPELEDSLRNTFESVGDCTLFLKEKTTEPDFDETQDPSVEEVAHN
jgi:hypothetical protein